MTSGITGMLKLRSTTLVAKTPAKREPSASLKSSPNAELLESVFNVTDSTSESEQEDEDDDFLARAMGKSKGLVDDMTKKRPSLFEEKNGVKKLKLPPPTRAPFSLNKSSVDTLRKSEELLKLHREDDHRAQAAVKKEEEFMKLLESGFDKLVFKDKSFIDYLKTHREQIKLKDFYYYGTPEYVKAKDEEPSLLMLCAIKPGKSSTFDIYNETDPMTIKEETRKLKTTKVTVEYINRFMRRIGVKETDVGVVDKESYQLNSYKKLQPIPLVLTKLTYLLTQVTLASFSERTNDLMIRIIGYTLLDTRLLHSSCREELITILTMLLDHQAQHTGSENYTKIINTWKSLTKDIALQSRLLENIPLSRSLRLHNLRRMYAVSILSDSPFPEIDTSSEDAIDTQLYNLCNICLKELIMTAGDLQDEDGDFHMWMFKLKAVIYAVKQGQEKDELAEITKKVADLRLKFPISYQNQEQAHCRAMIFMLSLLLEDRETPLDKEFSVC